MKKDRISVLGRIATVRSTERPAGAGWTLDRRTGLYVRRSKGKNMVVLAGLSMMAKSIQYGNASAGKTIRYIEVGTGYTAPAKAQTALIAATLRVAIDSWDNTDIASDPVVMIASKLFTTAQANANLMECGLFQESSGAPMFCRGLFNNGTIVDATQAEPVVITVGGDSPVAHGLTDGDEILIEGVGGMTELNNNTYYVDVQSADTFDLYSDAALTTPVDGGAYGAYTSGGTWKLVIPKTSSETLTVTYSLTFPAD
jgi:hypothetical protein